MTVYRLEHLLKKSVRDFPLRPAVVFRNQAMTYAELDRESTRLAAFLRNSGIRPQERVGIYTTKSINQIVSVFGVLKAGCAYVPLDPNAPLARLAGIISNARIRCLLASTRKADNLPRLFPGDNPLALVILLDGEKSAFPSARPWSAVAMTPPIPPSPEGIDQDCSYVLYTSGSTGVPKGVVISHRAALTFVDWSQDEFHLGPADRVSQHAPLHFDLSVFDIFTAVKAGAAIYPVPEEYSIFPVRLIKFLEDAAISVWYSVPSILVHLLAHGNLAAHRFPALRLVLFAGEPFPVKYLRSLMAVIPEAKYANLYGPTETNVCTFYRVDKSGLDDLKNIPIGKACANTQVYVLADDGTRVDASGQEGELYVRGSGLAAGYLGDPVKTAASFLTAFREEQIPETVYRTGDIVYYDDEGQLNLVGRRDHLVKSRGFRIELGDIEAALYSHPEVGEAAALAVPDELISHRIMAAVVLAAAGEDREKELKRYLAERIPAYMVPERIWFYESLPRTSTGKIDRQDLVEKVLKARGDK